MVLSKEQRSGELYRAAYACEQLRHKFPACKPGEQCGRCQFYIPGYVSMYGDDQADVALIKMSAQIDYAKEHPQHPIRSLFLLVLLISFVGFSMDRCRPAPTQSVKEQQILQNIISTEQCAMDINFDGLINCIDYSIIYYLMDPQSDLIQNQNPNTGMNHMFIRTMMDGKYIYIEPQKSNKGYRMEDIWGKAYDPKYNRIVSTLWITRVVGQLQIFAVFADDPTVYNELIDLYNRKYNK